MDKETYYVIAVVGLTVTLVISIVKHAYDSQKNRKEDADQIRDKISSLSPKLETLKNKPQSKSRQPTEEALVLKEEILAVINSIDVAQFKEKKLAEFQNFCIELDDSINSMIYSQQSCPIDTVKTKIKTFCKQLSKNDMKIF